MIIANRKKFKFTKLKDLLALKVYDFVTRKSLKLFMRAGDHITRRPQVLGEHEGYVKSLINQTARNGGSDFLIDIGANIGLISCQCGENFSEVFCFEPNPLCLNILRTNISISFQDERATIFDHGLGDSDGVYELYIPRHNWGGAFVRNENNYTDIVLARKDGFSDFDKGNYIRRDIQIRNTHDSLANIFSKFSEGQKISGVVKIDVEGFEKKILCELGKVLPSWADVTIVFENWDPSFCMVEIRTFFQKRSVEFFRFKRSVMDGSNIKLLKYVELVVFGEEVYLEEIKEDRQLIGDNVIKIT